MIVIQRYEVEGLGDRIRSARQSSGKSIAQLAFEAQMTTANWYRIEAENGSVPAKTIYAMGSALGGIDLLNEVYWNKKMEVTLLLFPANKPGITSNAKTCKARFMFRPSIGDVFDWEGIQYSVEQIKHKPTPINEGHPSVVIECIGLWGGE